MFKRKIRAPIIALFFISLGGLLLHTRIHPVGEVSWQAAPPSMFHYVPVLCGLVTVLVLPWLFNFRATVALAYLLNLAAVILGTVTMAYYSLARDKAIAMTWQWIVLQSTLPDILVLMAKVPLAHQILRYFRPKHTRTATGQQP